MQLPLAVTQLPLVDEEYPHHYRNTSTHISFGFTGTILYNSYRDIRLASTADSSFFSADVKAYTCRELVSADMDTVSSWLQEQPAWQLAALLGILLTAVSVSLFLKAVPLIHFSSVRSVSFGGTGCLDTNNA